MGTPVGGFLEIRRYVSADIDTIIYYCYENSLETLLSDKV